MKTSFLLFFLLISFCGFSQTNLQQAGLPETKSLLKSNSYFISIMASSIAFPSLDKSVYIYEATTEKLNKLIIDKDKPLNNTVYLDNRTRIDKALHTIFAKVFAPIVLFSAHNNLDSCIHIGNILYDKVFNTSRTDEKTRGKKVLTELSLPNAYKIAEYFKDDKFKYMAISSCYCKRDYTGSSQILDGCVITIVFRISDLQKVSNADITEEEFIKLSEIYITDESDFKRITIDF